MAPDAIQPDQTHIMLRLHHAEGREADPKDQDFPAVGASFGPSIAEYVGCVPGLYCGLQGDPCSAASDCLFLKSKLGKTPGEGLE